MRLSILICSLNSRQYFLDRILSLIEPQIDKLTDKVEIIIDQDNAIKIIGKKRNDLMARAKGDYIAFVDDDDLVPAYYIEETMRAIKTNPDCIGFKGIITTKSINPKTFIHSNRYAKWGEDEKYYYRTPNHWNAVRRELAIRAGFPEINYGEDHEYSRRLKPLLKTEVFIDKVMYYYLADGSLSVASRRKEKKK